MLYPFTAPSSSIIPAPASSFELYTMKSVVDGASSKQVTSMPASLDLVMTFSSTCVSLEHCKDTKTGKTETNLPWHVDQSRNIQGFCHINWHQLEKDWGCFEATRDGLLLRTWEERCHFSVPLSVKLCFQAHTYKMECVVSPQVLRKPVNASTFVKKEYFIFAPIPDLMFFDPKCCKLSHGDSIREQLASTPWVFFWFSPGWFRDAQKHAKSGLEEIVLPRT